VAYVKVVILPYQLLWIPFIY